MYVCACILIYISIHVCICIYIYLHMYQKHTEQGHMLCALTRVFLSICLIVVQRFFVSKVLRSIWTMLSDTGFEFWVWILCGTTCWSWWSLCVYSSFRYFMILELSSNSLSIYLPKNKQTKKVQKRYSETVYCTTVASGKSSPILQFLIQSSWASGNKIN